MKLVINHTALVNTQAEQAIERDRLLRGCIDRLRSDAWEFDSEKHPEVEQNEVIEAVNSAFEGVGIDRSQYWIIPRKNM